MAWEQGGDVMAAKRKEADMEAMGVRHVVARLVPDPMMTDAEFYHRRQTRPGPNVGMVSAQINLIELIGGLARIKGRDVVQEEAAARYRKLWEQALDDWRSLVTDEGAEFDHEVILDGSAIRPHVY